MSDKYKIIFLDFDGVINGSDPKRYITWKILSTLHLKSLYNKIYKEPVYGVHEDKVKCLGDICNSDDDIYVVLTSVWRKPAFDAIVTGISHNNTKIDRLTRLFYKYKIKVWDYIDTEVNGTKQDEIIHWLAKHENEIDDYIIIDDEATQLYALRERVIITANKQECNSNMLHLKEGLRNTHVKQAIEMFNSDEYKEEYTNG